MSVYLLSTNQLAINANQLILLAQSNSKIRFKAFKFEDNKTNTHEKNTPAAFCDFYNP